MQATEATTSIKPFEVKAARMLASFTHLTGSRRGERDEFDADLILIGRAPDNQLRFQDSERRVSAHHAEIRRRGGSFLLRDLGSTNGTMVNGRRVVVSELAPDDLIEFGAGGPLVRFGGAPAAAAPEVEKTMNGADTVPLRGRRATPGPLRRRANSLLLFAALVIAMLVGATAGVLLASGIDRRAQAEPGFASVAAQNSPAVVFIRAEFEFVDAEGQVVSSDARTGSGFVISTDGLVVTNRHVVRDWDFNPPPDGLAGRIKRIEVLFPGQRREQAIEAQLYKLGPNRDPDVAILKLAAPARLSVVRGLQTDLTRVSQGEEVAVIGYPLGLDLLRYTGDENIGNSLSVGFVSRVSPETIQLNLRAYRGNSGGPVLNRRGEVIGILTSNVGAAQDITFCTPISAALALLEGERHFLTGRTASFIK